MTTKAASVAGTPAAETRAPVHAAASASFETPVLGLLDQACVSVHLRRGQRIHLTSERVDTVFLVRSGLALLSTTLPGKQRQVICLLFPGDLFRTASLSHLRDIELTAASVVEMGRIRWAMVESIALSHPATVKFVEQHASDLQSRHVLHLAVIGRLSGVERVASLLIEMALRLGRRSATEIVFELPLTRVDVADYLSLNADTLSRVMSKLRADGVLKATGRNSLVVGDWQRLSALSPIADAIEAMIATAASNGSKTR